jgi:Ca2+-binding EF-hand superfamily protein
MSKTKNFNTEKEFEESENENQSIFQNTTSLNNNINEKENDLYEEFFNYFLPNNKKTLTIKECKNAMRCLGILITEKELVEYLEINEKNGKEKINLNEFISLCKMKKNDDYSDELEEAFKFFDINETGFVNSKELKHAMLIFKPKMNEEEIEQILNEYNIDEDGFINYKEYINSTKK